jgi:hypothetical protein
MDYCRDFRLSVGRFAVAFWVAVFLFLPLRASAEVATPAVVFLDSIGINAHVSQVDGPYRDLFALSGKLDYLGVKHVRDDVHETADAISRYQTLGSDGVKLTLMLSPGLVPDLDNALGTLSPLSSLIDTLEGANDVAFTAPSYNGYSGVAAAQAYQRVLWGYAKSHAPFATTARVAQFTYGPVVASPEQDGLADVGNVHLYPTAKQPPFYTIAMAARTLGLPAQKVFITEFNYPTSLDNDLGVDEATQAKYLLDSLFDSIKLGFLRTYIDEVMDEGQVPTVPRSNLGLFHYDGSPKMSARAIHNLTRLLGRGAANPPQASAAGALTYSISQNLSLGCMDANIYHLLLQGPTGKFYLVIWAEPPLYSSGAAIAPPSPHPVTVSFPSAHADIQVFDPLVGVDVVNDYQSTNSVTVSTVDHPLIIAISND